MKLQQNVNSSGNAAYISRYLRTFKELSTDAYRHRQNAVVENTFLFTGKIIFLKYGVVR
jgi:hypothetical protein